MPDARASAGWNYAEVWERVAERFPKATALSHGTQSITWEQLDGRANGVADAFLAEGLVRQDKVALYMRNRPQYLETIFAAFKGGVVPVNTNFRYADDEIIYLWRNSDAVAVVFDAEFTDVCARIRPKLPHIRVWLRVGDETECPPWAISYEQAAVSHPGRVVARWGRSGDDLFLLYTGGTTGMPKGVMWRQDDLFRMLESSLGDHADGLADPAAWAARLPKPGYPVLPAPPLMHGTACWFAFSALSRGGSVVTLPGDSLEASEVLDAIVTRGVQRLCIVGDAFAKPLLEVLDAEPTRWDLSRLSVIVSSGAILSKNSKKRMLGFAPQLSIFDGLGTSESGSLASKITSHDSDPATARFRLSQTARVIDSEGRDVVPGAGRPGRLAVGGHLPIGYYGDPEATAATFVTLDGQRFVVAGDWAEVDSHGEITLLGRGSSCINTAGEKVYPEEVEEVLKEANGVRDAAVIGIPDERFGEAVVALVEPESGKELDGGELIAYVKSRLASYKAPRRVTVVNSIGRGPNGKLDHRRVREIEAHASVSQ